MVMFRSFLFSFSFAERPQPGISVKITFWGLEWARIFGSGESDLLLKRAGLNAVTAGAVTGAAQ
jgi:hypothetical protein